MSFKKKELDCSQDCDHDDIHRGNCMIHKDSESIKLGEMKNFLDNSVEKVDGDHLVDKQKLDCTVVAEDLRCKGLDFEALKRSSVSFFNSNQSETVVSRWARARVKAAKVGKGLSKNEKAQKLALTLYWLEAIDPCHRYGHNLRKYYDVWFESESIQPFFYWLDIGDGKDVNLEKCPRTQLQQQCIKYLGPKEREAYEVVMDSGKLVYKQSKVCVDTPRDAEWIFVLSTSMNLYVGEKKKGHFQHSSFLSGAATIASGRLVAHNGILEAIWSSSGHYRPTEETLMEFCRFLEEHHVDLTNVKKCPIDEENPPKQPDQKETNADPTTDDNTLKETSSIPIEANFEAIEANVLEENDQERDKAFMVEDQGHHQ